MSAPTAPGWLTDAVLYQIYPQSFADSGGDGIGDLRGIAEHLDHLGWLGVTAVWLNPCFASPMRDAGYDVSDYFSIAARYGDNDELAKLVEQARARGIRVLLDLVPGHTSDLHPWFLASANDPADHRYVWADGAGGRPPEGFVASPGSRPGGYLPNFFDFQPALNFGYARQHPDEPWRQPVDAEGPRANYYGDEIGMRFVPGLPEKEGSVLGPHYNRAGSRTPMQWDQGPNAGFSGVPAEHVYLPIDPDPGRPDVATQRADEHSLLHLVRDLIKLRRANPELGPAASLEVLHDGYPLAYVRGGRFLVVVNPSDRAVELRYDRPELAAADLVRGHGVEIGGTSATAAPFAYGVFRF